MNNSNNSNNSNNDYYENYNGFDKISKAKNHVITVKSPYKVGVCDLNSNCSNIELDIEQIRNNRFNQTDSLNITSTQSNKIISNNNLQNMESNINFSNNSVSNKNDNYNKNKDNDNDNGKFTNNSPNSIFNFDNIIIIIFILLILFYLIKKRNKK